MKVYKEFYDERLKSDDCVYCSAPPDTRDHIPSKVFLNKPYPSNLMAVAACEKCNQQFSLDEQYMAFFIEYLKTMDSEVSFNDNSKLKNMIEKTPSLEKRILKNIVTKDDGKTYIDPEHSRIERVVQKHAFGYVYYETGKNFYTKLSFCGYKPIYLLSDKQIIDFNAVYNDSLFAEVGTRLMQRQVEQGNGWIVVQKDNYRYRMNCSQKIIVHIVFK